MVTVAFAVFAGARASKSNATCQPEAGAGCALAVTRGPACSPSRQASSGSRAALSRRGPPRAFHRLRPELREILSLAATGLSSHEIAASLSLPRPTASSWPTTTRAATRRRPARTKR
jgi:DNA-binding NarL/FixJ family response regulator